MRHLVGLFFNLLFTLLFNKSNVKREAGLYLQTHNSYAVFRRIQKLLSVCIIKLCHKNMHVKM